MNSRGLGLVWIAAIALALTGDLWIGASGNKASGQTYTLTVGILPAATGSVAVDPPGPYDYGDPVTLTAYPEAGWGFDHWSGDLSGSSNPAVLTILGNMEVTAHFDSLQYTLTMEIDPPGAGVVTMVPPGPYQHGEPVTLTAYPGEGWDFDHWSGDVTGNVNPVVEVIMGDTYVTAHFVEREYTVSRNVDPPGSGSVSVVPEGPYCYGDTVELTAVPGPGWDFDYWSGDLAGSTNPETIIIYGDVNVTAHFDSVEYTLALEVDPPGAGVVAAEPGGPYYYGYPVTLTAEAGAGWLFDHWSGDITGSVNPVVIVMTRNKSVTANFAKDLSGIIGEQVPEASSFRLYGACPNPFSSKTEIRFDLPEARHVSLIMYDVSGQLVRVLADRIVPAGRHAVVWDARDTALRPVPPGIYFFRFTAGESDETGSMVVLK
jgi:hypothetical protein